MYLNSFSTITCIKICWKTFDNVVDIFLLSNFENGRSSWGSITIFLVILLVLLIAIGLMSIPLPEEEWKSCMNALADCHLSLILLFLKYLNKFHFELNILIQFLRMDLDALSDAELRQKCSENSIKDRIFMKTLFNNPDFFSTGGRLEASLRPRHFDPNTTPRSWK